MRRPRIAVPEINQNVSNYTRALFAAGMEPVVISVQTEQTAQANQQEYLDIGQFRVRSYDGLLLPGGGDVNPARYGRESCGSVMVLDSLDELQLTVLDAFVKEKKPVLGICRGYQLVNVYFGGSLIQHLPTAFRHSRKHDEPDKAHGCMAEAGSWLTELYGRSFVHNSAHHQAIDDLGEGLVIDSHCQEDGVPEAMHHSALPIWGVQWHPERMCLDHAREDTVDGLPIFRFFHDMLLEKPWIYEI